MGVIIGMDPHKRSAAIEEIDEAGKVLAASRFGTDKVGYREMLAAGRRFPDRVWAVEGCNGIGKHIAHRLVHDGETVIDVPPKLSAQVRVFATGNGRKTDPVDAHSVAMVALRTPGLVRVQVDDDLVVMGMLADRHDELGRARTQTINRLHRILLELFPGGAKQFLSAQQARALIATIKPRDLVGKTRRRLAVELIVISATGQAITKLQATPRAHTAQAAVGLYREYRDMHGYEQRAAAYTDTFEGIDAVYVVAENETSLAASTWATPRGGPRRAGRQPASTRPRRSRSRAPRSRKRTRSRSARERLLPAWSTPLLPLAWATRSLRGARTAGTRAALRGP